MYLSSLTVAHLSEALRSWLVVTGDSARIQQKIQRAPPGSSTYSVYITVT